MTSEQRSRCMAAVKGRDTKPELIVRRFLHAQGLRYRVNVKSLPGSPDIVLRKYRTVVFVDGCFWHGHEGCKFFKLPTSNELFWRHKIATNFARDFANNADLRLAGWRVIRVWECDIKTTERREATLRSLYYAITTKHIPGNFPAQAYPSCSYGTAETDRVELVAEPQAPYGADTLHLPEDIGKYDSLTIYEPIHVAHTKRRT